MNTLDTIWKEILRKVELNKICFLVFSLLVIKQQKKLESRLLREISITSEMQMIPHLWQKVKRN